MTENHQRAENPKDKGANLQMLCQKILPSQNQPGILHLHVPQPHLGPWKASGRPPDMVFIKGMDLAIHRITGVKSVDNFYHPEANWMSTTGAITLWSFALYVKRPLAVPTHGIDICIHTIWTNSLYVINATKVLHLKASWLPTKSDTVQ